MLDGTADKLHLKRLLYVLLLSLHTGEPLNFGDYSYEIILAALFLVFLLVELTLYWIFEPCYFHEFAEVAKRIK